MKTRSLIVRYSKLKKSPIYNERFILSAWDTSHKLWPGNIKITNKKTICSLWIMGIYSTLKLVKITKLQHSLMLNDDSCSTLYVLFYFRPQTLSHQSREELLNLCPFDIPLKVFFSDKNVKPTPILLWRIIWYFWHQPVVYESDVNHSYA